MQLVMDMELPVYIDFKVNFKMSEKEILDNYQSILENGDVLYEKAFPETNQKVIIVDNSNYNGYWFISSVLATDNNSQNKLNSLLLIPLEAKDLQNEIDHLEANDIRRKKVSYKI